jgi:hypothetical protein
VSGLSSPERPTRGWRQRQKPTPDPCDGNSGPRGIGWKWERVSASERHGTVKSNLRSAVDAEEASAYGWWGLPPGLSTRTNNPAGLSSRTPSPTPVIPSELGHAAHRSALEAETPTGSTVKDRAHGRVVGPQRIVDQAKARGNARDTGVVPGCLWTELNSTRAEEVKVSAATMGIRERRVDGGATH